jgi:hypothetical protein
VRGVPLYGVLIGLEIEGVSQVGVAHFPALEETISAAKGCGCWWNGNAAHVSTLSRLDQALLAHADAASFARCGKGAAWNRLQDAAVPRRMGRLLRVSTGCHRKGGGDDRSHRECLGLRAFHDSGSRGYWRLAGNVTMLAGKRYDDEYAASQVLSFLNPW